MPQAFDASGFLPARVRRVARVEALTAIDERELVILACFYIKALWSRDRSRHDLETFSCQAAETHGGDSFESAYVPPSYDDLPSPNTFDRFPMVFDYLRRLRELESILGAERVRSIYEDIASPTPHRMSDFDLAGVIADLEAVLRYPENEGSLVPEDALEVEFDVDLVEESWQRYEDSRAETAGRMAEDLRWFDDDEMAWLIEDAPEAAESARDARDCRTVTPAPGRYLVH